MCWLYVKIKFIYGQFVRVLSVTGSDLHVSTTGLQTVKICYRNLKDVSISQVLLASYSTLTILLHFWDVIYWSVLSNVRTDDDDDGGGGGGGGGIGDHHMTYPSASRLFYIFILGFLSFDCVMIGGKLREMCMKLS